MHAPSARASNLGVAVRTSSIRHTAHLQQPVLAQGAQQQQQMEAARLLPLHPAHCNGSSPGISDTFVVPGTMFAAAAAAAGTAGAGAAGLRKGISALDLHLLQNLGPAGGLHSALGTPCSVSSNSSTPTGFMQQHHMMQQQQQGGASMLQGALSQQQRAR
jgi:hypothetical protein